MQLNNALQSKLQLLGALAILFSLSSCGSFQYAGNDYDGVYGETNNRQTEEPVAETSQATVSADNSNSNYYQDYFREKSDQYSNVNGDDDVIFTDIDSYQSDYVEVENDTIQHAGGGQAGWGDNASNITVNIYDGPGYNNFWWNRPYNVAWGWGNGWGYGWGYDPFWYTPYYGAGWYVGYNPWWTTNFYHRPFYNGFYGGYYHGYYGRRRTLAYNAGRRGYGRLASNQLSSIQRRSSVTRSSRGRNYSTRPSNRTTRPRVNTTRPGTSRPMVRPNSTTRPRVNTTRPGTSRPMVRPNNNSSRPRVRPNNSSSRPRVTPSRPRSNSRGYSRPSSSRRSSGMRSSGGSRSRRN
jgi:hypothetical protein